jgi:imidazoleglycerol-phosphate dehydratase
MSRTAEFSRKTKETEIVIKLNIDGTGQSKINTKVKFLDHMLNLFAFHGLFDLEIDVREADLAIDVHHTNEDIGICLGKVFKKALGDCSGIRRFGSSEAPMDNARAKVVVDISNRYAFVADSLLTLAPDLKEDYSSNDAGDLLNSMAKNLGMNLHIDIHFLGSDLHHILEAVFKALGIALDQATQIDPRRKEVPSTKGIL